MPYPERLCGVGLPAAVATQICGDVQDNITAAGSTQGTAVLLNADHCIVTTATGGAINALAANAGFSVAAAGQGRFLGRNNLNWVTY
jgi:hypothetical protein